MKKLSLKQTIIVASTLFGMFFGAGNLIFPVHLGQLAGKNVWQAIIGFIITAVGIPIFGVAAISSTHSNGLMELSSRVGKPYGIFFTCLLYPYTLHCAYLEKAPALRSFTATAAFIRSGRYSSHLTSIRIGASPAFTVTISGFKKSVQSIPVLIS